MWHRAPQHHTAQHLVQNHPAPVHLRRPLRQLEVLQIPLRQALRVIHGLDVKNNDRGMGRG